jgi:hypothetical protein
LQKFPLLGGEGSDPFTEFSHWKVTSGTFLRMIAKDGNALEKLSMQYV